MTTNTIQREHLEQEKEKILRIFLEDMNAMVFIRATNSVSGREEELESVVEDQEAIIKLRGEWDREDLKDILARIAEIQK